MHVGESNGLRCPVPVVACDQHISMDQCYFCIIYIDCRYCY